jgi:hypothetical protein
MIMQGGLHMVSFRKVAVFLGVVGLLFGVVSMVDAAHTKAHKRSAAESGELRRGPGAPEMILTGPVTSVSPAAGFLVMNYGVGKNAEEIPIDFDYKTTLMRGGRKIGIDDVKVGDRIRVRYAGQPGDVGKTVDVIGGPAMRTGTSKRRGSGM